MTGLGHLLAAIAFSAATLFFALLTLGNELHLLPVGFGDALGHDNLVETTKQLFDAFPVTAIDFHARRVSPFTPSRKLEEFFLVYEVREAIANTTPVSN